MMSRTIRGFIIAIYGRSSRPVSREFLHLRAFHGNRYHDPVRNTIQPSAPQRRPSERPASAPTAPTGQTPDHPRSRVISSAQAAALVQDGQTVALAANGGGMLEPTELIAAIEQRFLSTGAPEALHVIHALGAGDRDRRGLNGFAHEGLVKRVTGGHRSEEHTSELQSRGH